MLQFDVAQELHLPGSRSTIRLATRELGYYRDTPTKKLALIDIQEDTWYKIALRRKD